MNFPLDIGKPQDKLQTLLVASCQDLEPLRKKVTSSFSSFLLMRVLCKKEEEKRVEIVKRIRDGRLYMGTGEGEFGWLLRQRNTRLFQIRSHCTYPCECPVPPSCRDGVHLITDGCGCCRVCARQQGDLCDGTHLCDEEKGLVCEYSSENAPTGTCKEIYI
uniref:IGFBP N-terminal domain-containing protein n=1 Tax=Strigamia maritima TaxID=126957 RepID=T1JHT4_STRMM